MYYGQSRNKLLEANRLETEVLASFNLSIGKCIEKISRDVICVREKMELNQSLGSKNIVYGQVVKMSQKGHSINSLVNNFGVSKAKAKLALKLNADKPLTPTRDKLGK